MSTADLNRGEAMSAIDELLQLQQEERLRWRGLLSDDDDPDRGAHPHPALNRRPPHRDGAPPRRPAAVTVKRAKHPRRAALIPAPGNPSARPVNVAEVSAAISAASVDGWRDYAPSTPAWTAMADQARAQEQDYLSRIPGTIVTEHADPDPRAEMVMRTTVFLTAIRIVEMRCRHAPWPPQPGGGGSFS